MAYPPRCAGMGRWVNAWESALCPEAWSPGPALGLVRAKSAGLKNVAAHNHLLQP